MSALDSLPLASASTLAALAERGRSGADWYAVAEPLLAARAEHIGVPLRRYADILAITSPRVPVARNVAIAERYHAGSSLDGVLPGVVAGLAHYERTGIVRGPKTGPFAAALTGDTSAVVIDTWIARALVPPGRVYSRETVEHYQRTCTTVAGLRKATRRIVQAAELVGLTPRDAQAAIWHGVYRGTAPGLASILATLP